MPYLVYAAILGFTFWLLSEIIEIMKGGHNATVYYLTAAYHILAGIGIWGLHLLQSPIAVNLSLIATILISITYFALAYFPIQVLQSNVSVAEFLAKHPGYKIPGIISLIGFILFGIAIIRIKFFPAWTGITLICGTVLFALAMAKKMHLVVNMVNIIISATIIYMCIIGLS